MINTEFIDNLMLIIDNMSYEDKRDFFYYIVILAIINGNDKILSELPTSLLTNAGFSSEDIKKLIEEDGDIERIRRGIYQISPSIIEKLFDFGARLQETGAEDLAVKVFDGCYKLDPTYISAKCFNTFCNLIANKQYDEAIELYESLYAGGYSFVVDFRYYLFLLDKVAKLPPALDKLLKRSISYEKISSICNRIEITSKDPRFTPEERQARNNIRAAVAKNDCSVIRRQYPTILNCNTPQDKIEAKLLEHIITEEDTCVMTNGDNIRRGRYESAIDLLKKARMTRGLSTVESQLLLMLEIYAIDAEFLEKKHQELEESKIILLEPLNDECVKRMQEMNHFQDMIVEKINLNGQVGALLRKITLLPNNFEGIKATIKEIPTGKHLYARDLLYALLKHARTADEIDSRYYSILGDIEKRFLNSSQAATCYTLASAFAPTPALAIKYRRKALDVSKEDNPIEEYLPKELTSDGKKELLKTLYPSS